jgi:two-component system chemotaxis sensor kinase CheA
MKDPLVHLIRNCIDHGIEKPAERLKKGKPPKGKISIDVSQKSTNEVEILISDDGAGFNLEKIKSSAVKLGVLSQTDSENMSDTEIISLTFLSGISSSPIITHTSGRGLGLAIVLEKVEKLTGNISVESLPDVGTTFKIRLPLTLAAFRGIIVRLNEQHFVIPTINIERVLRTNIEQIKTVKNKETIEFEERAVSLVRLKDVLELPQTLTDYSIRKVPIVVLSLAQKRIAFQVDEILNEQEVLIKNYGGQLSRVRNFLGATILGSGKVVPIINVSDLFKSAVRFGRTEPITIMKTINDDVKLKKVLVVEDSITSRTLLKNILISAGYNVETAVDGIDGFTKLCMDEFDIVVSDVDMPKMNGFDLTAKIRNDKKYSNIPVVLVTSLESNEHKEHGIDVGANAYIVKSSFDQGNLLEIIRRLV